MDHEKKKSKGIQNLWSFTVLLIFVIFWAFLVKQYYISVSFTLVLIVVHWLDKSSRNWKNTLDKIFDFPFVIITLSPIFTYLLINLAQHVVRSYPGLLPIQGTKSDWIGFSGSIIGGAMTLYAVVFTLQYEREERQNEKSLSILPLLKCEVSTQKGTKYSTIKQYREFIVKNISMNHAKNIRISKVYISWMKPKDDGTGDFELIKNKEILGFDKSSYISVLQEHLEGKLKISLEEGNTLEEIVSQRSVGNECIINIQLEYEDILGIRKYIHEYSLTLDLVLPDTIIQIGEGHFVPDYQYRIETNEFELRDK